MSPGSWLTGAAFPASFSCTSFSDVPGYTGSSNTNKLLCVWFDSLSTSFSDFPGYTGSSNKNKNGACGIHSSSTFFSDFPGYTGSSNNNKNGACGLIPRPPSSWTSLGTQMAQWKVPNYSCLPLGLIQYRICLNSYNIFTSYWNIVVWNFWFDERVPSYLMNSFCYFFAAHS